MDTRFSMAIQLLALIALAPEPMSSAQMAESVGTNPCHVRRLLGQLKKAGLVAVHQGTSGFELLCRPEELDLARVYRAMSGHTCFHAFDLHQNTSDVCLVGRHIRPVLSDMFADMERLMQQTLEERSLADCIAALRSHAASETAAPASAGRAEED